MNVNKININQTEPTYNIASNAYDITYENSNVGEELTNLNEKVDTLALGTFYGFFPNSKSLPIDVTALGYAYVGTDNPYEIWNFNGKSWSDSGTTIDMNVDADEEDITRNRDGKLQFKNRAYGNGMGYVILRKDKSFAEQMTKENTIYEIRYDFTLGKNVTIPNNCILKFEGGSISGNYTLTGQNTNINAGLVKIFNTNVTLSGTWNVAEAYPEWFGAKGDGITDDAPAINCALLYFNCVILSAKSYTIGSVDTDGIGIRIPVYRTLRGIYHDENLSKVSSVITIKQGVNYTSVVSITGNNCILEDFSVRGWGVDSVETACVSTNGKYSRCAINRVDVAGTYYGFNLLLYLTTMTQCNANYCSIGFYIHGSDSTNAKYTTFVAICCYACDCRIRGHYWRKMTYSSLISCAADSCGCPNSGVVDNNTELGFAYYFDDCDTISVIDCGCERCLRAIYCNKAQPVIFKGCNFYINKHQNSTFNSSFALTDIIIIRYSVEVEIDNCIIETSTVSSYYTETSELIQIYGTSEGYRMLIYKPSIMGFINLSNIKTQGGVSIYRNLYYKTTRYCRNSTEGARPTFKNAFEKTYYIGFIYYDDTLHKPIWWNGSNWVDATGATV